MQEIIQTAEYKTCSKCAADKFVENFHRDKSKKDGLNGRCIECKNKYQKQYHQENRKNILEKQRQYQKKIPDKIRAYQKQYRNENRVGLSAEKKQYYQDNREIMRYNNNKSCQKRKEKKLEYNKQYVKTESGKAARLKAFQKHRALKLGAKIEDFKAKEVFIRDRYICQACGIKTRPDYKNPNHPKYPNLDHIIPLSVGGEHSRRNTQCLCHQCNMEKGNRHANDQMLLIG